MEKREILKETELFVLDMDGTFYLDTDVLDGALDFLEEVKKAGKRYVFFTNNSSKSPPDPAFPPDRLSFQDNTLSDTESSHPRM